MSYLQIASRGEIQIITVNRPEALNALNSAILSELKLILNKLAKDGTTKAVLLTGNGEKAFIAGADIVEIRSNSPAEMLAFCLLGQEVADLLQHSPFLTLAAVNGYALGGGFELALACDLIYANTKAHFGLPEITLGIIPGFGGTQRLTQMIGLHRSKELILTGRMITGIEAEELGIVNRVCAEEALIPESIKMAEKVIQHSLQAIVAAKKAINFSTQSQEAGFDIERSLCAHCLSTPAAREAIDQFLMRKKDAT